MDSVIKCNDYIIGKHTYLLESKHNGEKIHTIVYDRRGIYEVAKSPLNLVKKNCNLFGSSYEASLQQSKYVLGKTQTHKLPVVVGYDFGKPLILYPLFSPQSKQNTWIMFNNVTEFNFQSMQPSIVLGNQFEYPLPVHKSTITSQTTASFALYKKVETLWRDKHFL